MSANRKMAYVFDAGNSYADAGLFIADFTLRDHFAAALNGRNSVAVAVLLDTLVKGELDSLTANDRMQHLWAAAGFKPEHLTAGTLAIVATGRGFGFNKAGLPISLGKVFDEKGLKVKALVWDLIGNGSRHINEKEFKLAGSVPEAVKAVEVVAEPAVVLATVAVEVKAEPVVAAEKPVKAAKVVKRPAPKTKSAAKAVKQAA